MEWQIALLSRLVFVGYAALLILFLGGSRPKVLTRLTVMVLALVAIPMTLAAINPPVKPPLQSTFYSMVVPPGRELRYEVKVGEPVIAALKEIDPRDATIQFITPGIHSPYTVTVKDGQGNVWASSTEGQMIQRSKVGLQEVVQSLDREPELRLSLATRPEGQGGHPIGTTIFGWQRFGLPNRSLFDGQTGAPLPSQFLPQFELRVLNAQGRLLFVGY